MAHTHRPTGAYLHYVRRHLKRGGLIAYPAEGCYGLGCLPCHAVGLRRLIHLKKRPQYKGLIVVGADSTQLWPLLDNLSVQDKQTIAMQWPAPKTLLLPARPGILPLLRGRTRTALAVRVPGLASARFLCQAVASPLVSTSCNRSGKRPCHTEREAWRQFGQKVLLIGGRTGGRKSPSEIIDWVSGLRLR